MLKKKVKRDRLIGLVSRFPKVRALVVGDIILDQYIWGKASRLSPEAPVPIVWADRQEYLLGGSSNVAHNIVALGAGVGVCGVIGKDPYGQEIASLLKKRRISSDLVITDDKRPTTLKTRIIAQHQQVVRVDWESSQALSGQVNKKVVSYIKNNLSKFDLVIIEDYGKGVINPVLLRELVGICRKNKKIITVDPKEDHFDYYRQVTALTPNLKEAEYASGMSVRKDKDLDKVASIILKRLQPEALLITLGDKGMKLFLNNNKSFHLPVSSQEVFDVSGAGDTVIAVFSLAKAAGASFMEASYIANVAAGLVVSRLGVSVTNPKELKERLSSLSLR